MLRSSVKLACTISFAISSWPRNKESWSPLSSPVNPPRNLMASISSSGGYLTASRDFCFNTCLLLAMTVLTLSTSPCLMAGCQVSCSLGRIASKQMCFQGFPAVHAINYHRNKPMRVVSRRFAQSECVSALQGAATYLKVVFHPMICMNL